MPRIAEAPLSRTTLVLTIRNFLSQSYWYRLLLVNFIQEERGISLRCDIIVVNIYTQHTTFKEIAIRIRSLKMSCLHTPETPKCWERPLL